MNLTTGTRLSFLETPLHKGDINHGALNLTTQNKIGGGTKLEKKALASKAKRPMVALSTTSNFSYSRQVQSLTWSKPLWINNLSKKPVVRFKKKTERSFRV